MEINKAIKTNLLSILEFSDKIVEVMESNKIKIKDKIDEIILKDKKDEDCVSDINNHRALISYSYLLNDDLRKVLIQLSCYYKIATVSNVELDLSEQDVKRLDFILKNEGTYFVQEKDEVVPKDKDLYDKLVSKISDNKNFTHKEFLESLRKSPIYGTKG